MSKLDIYYTVVSTLNILILLALCIWLLCQL